MIFGQVKDHGFVVAMRNRFSFYASAEIFGTLVTFSISKRKRKDTIFQSKKMESNWSSNPDL